MERQEPKVTLQRTKGFPALEGGMAVMLRPWLKPLVSLTYLSYRTVRRTEGGGYLHLLDFLKEEQDKNPKDSKLSPKRSLTRSYHQLVYLRNWTQRGNQLQKAYFFS